MHPRDACRRLGIAIAYGMGYAGIAAATILLTQSLHSRAYPWPANPIFLALMCRLPLAKRTGPLIAIGCAMATLILLMTRLPLVAALAFGVISTLEVGIGSWLITDRLKLDFRAASTFDVARGFVLAGVLAPLPSSLIAGALASTVPHLSFAAVAFQRWHNAVLMFLIFAPPILFYSNAGLRRLCSRERRWENLGQGVITVLFVGVCFHYVPFPFVTLMLPLLFVAYRQGPMGTALMGFLVTSEVILLWVTQLLPPLTGTAGGDPLASLPLVAIASMLLAPIALSLEIQRQRAALRALRASERETAQIIEQSPVGMAVFPIGSEGGTLNDAFLRMLGREGERGQPVAAASFMDEAQLSLDREAGVEVLEGKRETIRGRRQYRHRDGSYLWVQVRASLNRDADGSPKRWLLQAESIDERLRNERLLQSERERLRITLESVGDGVLTIDRDGIVTYANSAVLKTLGQPAASVLGQPLHDVLTLTEIRGGQRVQSMLAMAEISGESVTRAEAVVLHTPGGEVCYVRETVSPLQLEQGAVSGWVIAIHDVTLSHLRELEARKRADVDAVTGLANRHSFLSRVDKVFQRARMLATPAAVVAIDLDHFKQVNDNGGHAAGDRMLHAVGEVIASFAHGHGLAARIGGDEFALLLDRCDRRTAAEIGARLVAAIQATRILHDGAQYAVGASVGVAETAPNLATAAQWIAAADAACYRAKRAGRGQACEAGDAA